MFPLCEYDFVGNFYNIHPSSYLDIFHLWNVSPYLESAEETFYSSVGYRTNGRCLVTILNPLLYVYFSFCCF